LIPLADLICLMASVVAIASGHPIIAMSLIVAALLPAGLRAARMLKRQRRDAVTAAQALAVAIVFDLARALALIARGSHRARRLA
jgi:cytochrome bd-type quinol oxidase subunit 1